MPEESPTERTAQQFIGRLYARWNAEGIRSTAEDFFDAGVVDRDDAVWPGGGAHHGRPAMVARFAEVVETLGITESADAALRVVGAEGAGAA